MSKGPNKAIEYYINRRGKIQKATPDERRLGLWEPDQGRIYATCHSCGRISDITRHEVNKEGFIIDSIDDTMGCVICWCCRSHLFIQLEGWKHNFKTKS